MVWATLPIVGGPACVRPRIWCAEAGSPECIRLDGYRGSRNFTKTGKPCRPWGNQGAGASAGSSCRNPDAHEAPWCFIGSGQADWEYCFPACDELRAEEKNDNPRSPGGGTAHWVSSGKLQGDIAVSSEALTELIEKDNTIFTRKFTDKSLDILQNAIRSKDYLWAGGRVPFRISTSFNDAELAVIQSAMEAFHTLTCVRFVPRTESDKNFLYLRPVAGCSSEVGRKDGPLFMNGQTLSLDWGCVTLGTVQHELMHALGFFHEQSRTDRDEFVQIIEKNIQKDKLKNNFDKYGIERIQSLDAPYDYASVLHYPKDAFAANQGETTIVQLQTGPEIGNREGFSEWDVIKINRLYNCAKATDPRTIVLDKNTAKGFPL